VCTEASDVPVWNNARFRPTADRPFSVRQRIGCAAGRRARRARVRLQFDIVPSAAIDPQVKAKVEAEEAQLKQQEADCRQAFDGAQDQFKRALAALEQHFDNVTHVTSAISRAG
jgi:hypothetical protein